ncbi:hypothetical protein BCR34DRAFT_580707 [Clohesyomyces aquaticus]|uniref:Uncharacterized protein n=1 Tax=Clohesyomyces aquaticus TaxID=1231657 RepID=A0A1Y1Y516_9PLEO|nr:hypothetical protein BCR34DRAFT_580707 [Clohesyomyces aquaticus]
MLTSNRKTVVVVVGSTGADITIFARHQERLVGAKTEAEAARMSEEQSVTAVPADMSRAIMWCKRLDVWEI